MPRGLCARSLTSESIVTRQWRWGELNVAHVACSYNAPEILAWALEQLPAMMAMEDPMGRLPLHWCAFESVTNMVKLLLDASKAHDPALLQHQLDHKDRAGKTPDDLVTPMPRWAAVEKGAEVWVEETRQALREARAGLGREL